jgi:hypothetical protein
MTSRFYPGGPGSTVPLSGGPVIETYTRPTPKSQRPGLGEARAIDQTDKDGAPAFLDRRKATGGADDAAEPTYLDLVGGDR